MRGVSSVGMTALAFVTLPRRVFAGLPFAFWKQQAGGGSPALLGWGINLISDSTFAVKTNGTLWSLGRSDGVDQIRDGTTVSKSSQVQIGVHTNWSWNSSGGGFMRAIKS